MLSNNVDLGKENLSKFIRLLPHSKSGLIKWNNRNWD